MGIIGKIFAAKEVEDGIIKVVETVSHFKDDSDSSVPLPRSEMKSFPRTPADARLVCVGDPEEDYGIPPKGMFSIGRSMTNHIQLLSAKDDIDVSRHVADISSKDGKKFKIRLSSESHGGDLYVNDTAVNTKGGYLKDGDVIAFGSTQKYKYRFCAPNAAISEIEDESELQEF